MDPRDADGSSRPSSLQQMQSGSFGAYFQQQQQQHHHHHRAAIAGGAAAGFSQPSPPSIIHAPAAMRFPAASASPALSSPSPNPSSSLPVSAPDTTTHGIQQQQQQMPATSSPAPGMSIGMGMAMVLPPSYPVKRKRGRPRKYATDPNGVALGLSPSRLSVPSPREKKARGSGSGKKAQLSALGATGQGFTPHVLTVAAGEDVATKIMSFTQHGPWAVCILSANGAISNATLRHAGMSSGYVTYEGRFEILSLSGLFLLTENGGAGSRTGGLSVSLAGPDGRLIGGGVAGLLMAATPVQVVVGTFFAENRKSQSRGEGTPVPGMMQVSGSMAGLHSLAPIANQSYMDATGAMQDHAPMHGIGDGVEQHHMSQMMPLQSSDWAGSQFDLEARNDADPITSSPRGS